MGRRYVTRPKGWQAAYDEYWQERPSCTVMEEDRSPVDTGLLDANGTKLWRVEDREPMGLRLAAKDPTP